MTSASFQRQRCFNHGNREAVARCRHCERTYCRECITEHADAFVCASCLAAQASQQPAAPARRAWQRLATLAAGIGGTLLLWWLFYLLGQILLRIPADFHEGMMWENLLP